MVSKVDQDAMRDTNRKLMLQALFNAQQTSRSEIAEQIALHNRRSRRFIVTSKRMDI